MTNENTGESLQRSAQAFIERLLRNLQAEDEATREEQEREAAERDRKTSERLKRFLGDKPKP